MKKLLLVLAVGAFVACNNGGSEEPAGDTPVTPTPDTPAVVVPDSPAVTNPADTSRTGDTSNIKK